MKGSKYASRTLDLEAAMHLPLASIEIGLAFLLSSICPKLGIVGLKDLAWG